MNNGAWTIASSVHLQTVDAPSPVALPAACAFAENENRLIVWSALEAVSPRRNHWIGKFTTVVLVAGLTAGLSRREGTTEVSVVAPGTNLPAAVNNSAYDRVAGHSVATPIVAGAIALAQLAHNDPSAPEVRELLKVTSCQPPTANGSAEYGVGVVNVKRLMDVSGVLPSCPPM